MRVENFSRLIIFLFFGFQIRPSISSIQVIGNLGKEVDTPGVSNGTAHSIHSHPPRDLKDATSQAEYETIMNVLKEVKFNKTKAAELLKIDRKTLYNKMRQYEESNQLRKHENNISVK